MKRYVLAAAVFWCGILCADSAVTYTFSGGRFGDNLLSYVHAKWISYRYGIPLLYKPFEYSDQLKLHAVEEAYRTSDELRFKQTVILSKNNIRTLKFEKAAGVLYVVPYFPESKNEPNVNKSFPKLFDVDWSDVEFINLLRSLITPLNGQPAIAFPEGYARLAVHVRRKSGRDVLLADEPDGKPQRGRFYSDTGFPFKHLPDEYYIEQIKNLHQLIGLKPLYVYLFTDIENPPALVEKYRQAIPDENVIFDCRRPGDHHMSGVIEDLVAMMQFEYLIRNESNLSFMASKLGDYIIQTVPVQLHFEHGQCVIDEVALERR